MDLAFPRAISLILSGMMMLSSAQSAKSADDQPVWLDIRQEGGQAVICVVAAWRTAIGIDVDLQIAGASNLHTANRATLQAHAPPVILSRATIDARKGWSARLDVRPQGMAAYQIVRQSD